MNDAAASLIPLSVIAVGIDWCGGWIVLNTYVLPLLNQIGF